MHGVNNETVEGVDLVTLLNHRLWRVKTAFDHFVKYGAIVSSIDFENNNDICSTDYRNYRDFRQVLTYWIHYE